MKKRLKEFIEPLIFTGLLLIFYLIFPEEIKFSQIIFYMIPIVGGTVYRRLIKTDLLRQIILKLKYLFSKKPILWKFSGEYEIGEISCETFINKCKEIIDGIATTSYESKLTVDIKKQCNFLGYLSGVRISINYIEIENCIKINIESESPMKTFVRQHYVKLIKVFFEKAEVVFNIPYDSKKISFNVNKFQIPLNVFECIDNESVITEYSIGIHEKDVNVSLNKNKGFTCVGKNTSECYNTFTKYILVNDI